MILNRIGNIMDTGRTNSAAERKKQAVFTTNDASTKSQIIQLMGYQIRLVYPDQ